VCITYVNNLVVLYSYSDRTLSLKIFKINQTKMYGKKKTQFKIFYVLKFVSSHSSRPGEILCQFFHHKYRVWEIFALHGSPSAGIFDLSSEKTAKGPCRFSAQKRWKMICAT